MDGERRKYGVPAMGKTLITKMAFHWARMVENSMDELSLSQRRIFLFVT